jgi:hypothetical protein
MLSFEMKEDPETKDQIISKLTEYKFMQYVLSNFDEYELIDWHTENGADKIPQERTGLGHPVTYADTKIDREGKEVPRET